VSRRRTTPGNPALGLAGTVMVHGLAGVLLVGEAPSHRAAPPVYKVQLVAAPAPEPGARKAPEAVERAAEEQPAPIPDPKPAPKSAASPAVPPKAPDATRREAAPRTTPKAAPLPGVTPSTGNDEVSVSTEGVAFPYPEYLENIVVQIHRRWQKPYGNASPEVEVSFFIHRDGSITDLQFVKRSGNFGFDLEAQGAIEETGRSKVFGPLPSGWESDVLFVRFMFSAKQQ